MMLCPRARPFVVSAVRRSGEIADELGGIQFDPVFDGGEGAEDALRQPIPIRENRLDLLLWKMFKMGQTAVRSFPMMEVDGASRTPP